MGASFFCSRGDEDRSDLQLIFPTPAFQFAQKYSEFRSPLIPLLQYNPNIVHESLQDQVQKFLVDPLRSANIPATIVIVIDALDEYKDEEPESAILLVLGQSVSKTPTSRPEPHTTTGLRGQVLEGLAKIFVLHVEPCVVDRDIHCFVKHELSRLARRHCGVDDWPTDDR